MKDVRYRFHGSIEPVRRSVLAEVSAPNVTDGVATLRLYDPIDSWGGVWGVSAKEFAASLDALGEVTEIRLHINSPGGEVFEGVAIANLLRQHPACVVAVVDGLAASAASFIACAADETVMSPNTQLMIHDAWGLCVGNAADMRELADLLDRLSENVASIYHEKAGETVQFWREAMLAETWYSADEAVTAGLADSVQGDASKDDPAAFDLSVFKYQGREQAPAPTTAVVTETPELVKDEAQRAAEASNAARAKHLANRHNNNGRKVS